MVCGEAWVMQHVAIELIECTPETCPEDVQADDRTVTCG
jgi:hypothetical protein